MLTFLNAIIKWCIIYDCYLLTQFFQPLQSPKQLRILKRTSELQLMPSSVGETVKSSVWKKLIASVAAQPNPRIILKLFSRVSTSLESWSQASCCLEDNQMEFQKFYETIMSFGSHKATQNGCEVLEDWEFSKNHNTITSLIIASGTS